MKALLPMLFVLPLVFSGCKTVEQGRESLETMSQARFEGLKTLVRHGGEAASVKINEELHAQDKANLIDGLSVLEKLLGEDHQLRDLSVFTQLVEDLKTNFSPKVASYVDDVVKIIDAAVGDIRVGVDGKLSEREKDLLLTLLRALKSKLVM